MSEIDWSKRWPHFTQEELFSPDQLSLIKTKGVFPYSFRALDKLHQFRESLGVSLLINGGKYKRRGGRSMADVYEINEATRGKGRGMEYSFHLWCAFDVSSPEMQPEQVFRRACDSKLWGGVGLYDSFVHLDDRDSLSGRITVWDFRKR